MKINISKLLKKFIRDNHDETKKSTTIESLFLGCRPSSIIHFVKWRELLTSPKIQLNKIKSLLDNNKVKLIINGNLDDAIIKFLLVVALKSKNKFSIIVHDGFRQLKQNMSKSEKIAVLVVDD